ncbi:MAG TPA: glycosyltransferase N-terminal domain-containing protein [Candidatus Polarisedimenticolaceae bacterium]|nr:glycosyltransferase N-terminal domain-containing protein [Candidatus Polarisedimenticolaceae bacterium]
MTAPSAGSSLSFALYDALLSVLFPLARAYAARDVRRAPDRQREWEERLGRALPHVREGGLWLHGASVGEARLAGLLARSIRAARPAIAVSVSCVTRTGRAALPQPPAVDASFFAPLDQRRRVRPVLRAVSPAALALIETELWPGLVREAAAARCRLALVNARLAPERMARYRRLRALYRPLLGALDRIGAGSSGDAERLLALGARPETVTVTGNLKYDLPVPALDPASLRLRFGLPVSRPVLVAGSTGEGEDGPVLDAFLAVRQEGAQAFLVLAPRHPERAHRAADLARARGLRTHALSSGDDGAAGAADVLVVDGVGELARLYGMATVAFVGGSLVPVGGHNVLEPAAAGAPVLFGPHTAHVEDPAQALLAAGAARRVADAAALGTTWSALLRDPAARAAMVEAAGRVLDANRGALARTTALLEELL